ncbi:hypothetical protein [Mucilaginibacter oryzae]|nr:hypothetical protein [Mucilaginibacter oryzae]
MAMAKLNKTLPSIIEIFRFAIFQTVKKNETNDLDEVLKKLESPNNEIRDMIKNGLDFLSLKG